MQGDIDIAPVAALMGDAARARVLLALGDGRALPASVLAAEAGIAPSTGSAHLAKLVQAGLLTVERHGRHRYFRLAGPEVAGVLEALSRIAPVSPIRSLRQGTRAHAVRAARLCYDHLAGRLGVTLMAALIDRGVLAGGDGRFHADTARTDHLSASGHDVAYRLSAEGVACLGDLGIDVSSLGGRRPLIRYCVDWSEQRHHVGGALGAALAQRLLELDWVRHAPVGRAIHVTEAGREGLAASFRIDLSNRAADTRTG